MRITSKYKQVEKEGKPRKWSEVAGKVPTRRLRRKESRSCQSPSEKSLSRRELSTPSHASETEERKKQLLDLTIQRSPVI